MHLLAEFLMAENGLMLARGRGAVEIIAHEPEGGGQGKGLGREQELAPGLGADARGGFQVCAKAREIEQESGGGEGV